MQQSGQLAVGGFRHPALGEYRQLLSKPVHAAVMRTQRDNRRHPLLYGNCRFEIQIRRHGSNGKEPRGLRHALPGPEDSGGDYHLGGQIASSSLGHAGRLRKSHAPAARSSRAVSSQHKRERLPPFNNSVLGGPINTIPMAINPANKQDQNPFARDRIGWTTTGISAINEPGI